MQNYQPQMQYMPQPYNMNAMSYPPQNMPYYSQTAQQIPVQPIPVVTPVPKQEVPPVVEQKKDIKKGINDVKISIAFSKNSYYKDYKVTQILQSQFLKNKAKMLKKSKRQIKERKR